MGLQLKHNEALALVAQMTLAEKVEFCSGRSFWHLHGNKRLDIPSVMVTDGPHGLRKQSSNADHVGLNKSVPATCFPTACGLASTWNRTLIKQVGEALGRECVAENVTVLLGPGVNIKRHPLCGRNFEYYSEDPLLTGVLASAWIEGVQDQGVGTSIKHYAVNNQETRRMFVDAIVDERTLREIYLKGFEIAIKQTQPWTVMCAYNRLNGIYCSEHNKLLNEILRDDWGFEGLVVSDWGAANERPLGVANGMDLEMPASGGYNDQLVAQAVEDGELSEAALDRSIARIVSLALLAEDVEARQTINLEQHHELARITAEESLVLLKNDNDTLPLHSPDRIAIIGAFAKHPRYQGTGSSQVNPTRLDCAYDAFQNRLPEAELLYAPGYDPATDDIDPAAIDAAVEAARTADVAIVFAGLPGIYESEGFDRSHMQLPEQHNNLIAAVAAANTKTIVVLANGAPVSMPWVDDVPAIIETYLPGQAGGPAVVRALLGDICPSGKLAETFPLQQADVPSDPYFPGEGRQVQYREGLYVGYRYYRSFNVPVLFPFGHGLSYTTFEYDELEINKTADGKVLVSCSIANTGDCRGQEVVQLYVLAAQTTVYTPKATLQAFSKIDLQPGEIRGVEFELSDAAFSYFDSGSQSWNVIPGDHDIAVAASSEDFRLRGSVRIDPNDAPSDTALSNGPIFQDGQLLCDDPTFAGMLGGAIPEVESMRPFHMNSSLKEIGTTWLGAKFRERAVAGFMQGMGQGEGASDATLRKMFEEMADNMPLRAIVQFSQGSISPTRAETLIALLNGQLFRAAKLALQR